MKLINQRVAFIFAFGIWVCTGLAAPSIAVGAPSISGASGELTHGQNLVISGSGFGAKATPAPAVWDNCSGSSISAKWSGGWPNAGTSNYQLAYQSPIRGVGLPHSNITKYMAGSHGDNNGYNAGYNVMVYKTLTGVTYPKYIYWSAYTRMDPSWVFGQDNNLKTFDFSNGSSPFTMNSSNDSNWYAEYNGRFASAGGSGSWHLNDDGGTLISPDAAGKSWWWNNAANPYQKWIKQEFELVVTNQNSGSFKVWEDGVLRVNYTGPTDKYTGTTKAVAIGGYARMSGQANNWRYFADLYYDESLSRTLLCNGSTYANRGVCENQIPSAWSPTSISVSVNAGAFTANQQAYLYVVDSTGASNANGYPINIGGVGTAPAELAAPKGLRIE